MLPLAAFALPPSFPAPKKCLLWWKGCDARFHEAAPGLCHLDSARRPLLDLPTWGPAVGSDGVLITQSRAWPFPSSQGSRGVRLLPPPVFWVQPMFIAKGLSENPVKDTLSCVCRGLHEPAWPCSELFSPVPVCM